MFHRKSKANLGKLLSWKLGGNYSPSHTSCGFDDSQLGNQGWCSRDDIWDQYWEFINNRERQRACCKKQQRHRQSDMNLHSKRKRKWFLFLVRLSQGVGLLDRKSWLFSRLREPGYVKALLSEAMESPWKLMNKRESLEVTQVIRIGGRGLGFRLSKVWRSFYCPQLLTSGQQSPRITKSNTSYLSPHTFS